MKETQKYIGTQWWSLIPTFIYENSASTWLCIVKVMKNFTLMLSSHSLQVKLVASTRIANVLALHMTYF